MLIICLLTHFDTVLQIKSCFKYNLSEGFLLAGDTLLTDSDIALQIYKIE